MNEQQNDPRARVVFLIRVPRARTEDFLRAYEQIRYEVAEGVPGHLVDQVCQSPADPEQWLITSEWRTLADFEAWERSPGHRELARPMRDCMTEARSLRFVVRQQTTARPATHDPAPATVEG
ncbi:antibiotic biosynthesis monooxygenase family protein [Goodfellowiella coeruleoviolacea]|uniref:Antibiotic biosynthesis monooxygenase n=1 Tax=Goodfellowiella coeruleoviolacea TaxID=334858 RepID=A0AAE3GFY0_9PSEU|nr:antibiotic biosynthesis monooxygenase family protein [Goodfellowiella coeruleoviolacea]MCP2167491.1 Antibiotic biosynthesis monooxygenase [Goodfellowiella coeruleoviolacea]